MGLRPTQGNEDRLLFSNRSPWKRRLPLCHPDRLEGSAVQRAFLGNVAYPDSPATQH